MIKSYHPRFKVCVRKNICLFIYSTILQDDRFRNMEKKAWTCTLNRFMSIYFFLADSKSVWLDYLIFYHLLNRNILLLLFCVCSIISGKYLAKVLWYWALHLFFSPSNEWFRLITFTLFTLIEIFCVFSKLPSK